MHPWRSSKTTSKYKFKSCSNNVENVEKADSSLEMFYTLRKSDESYHYGSSNYKVVLQISEDNRSELYKVGA